MQRKTVHITTNQSAVGESLYTALTEYQANLAFQATVAGDGEVTSVVHIEFSNDGVGWCSDSTSQISLNGTNVASDAFINTSNFMFVRANIISLVGTNAKVTVSVGVQTII